MAPKACSLSLASRFGTLTLSPILPMLLRRFLSMHFAAAPALLILGLCRRAHIQALFAPQAILLALMKAAKSANPIAPPKRILAYKTRTVCDARRKFMAPFAIPFRKRDRWRK